MQPASPATACLRPAEAPVQAAGTVGARDQLGSLPRPGAGSWLAHQAPGQDVQLPAWELLSPQQQNLPPGLQPHPMAAPPLPNHFPSLSEFNKTQKTLLAGDLLTEWVSTT